jgi:chitodextrinase
VTLYWQAPNDKGAGLAQYAIYRDGAVIGTISALAASFRDNGLKPSTSYVYKIVAVDTAKQASPPSASATVKTKAAGKGEVSRGLPSGTTVKTPAVVGVPGRLKVRDITATSATLHWDPPKNSPPLQGYRLYRGVSLVAVIAADKTSFIDDTIVAATSYTYTIAAFDKAGNNSPKSDPVTIKTPAR